MQTEYWRTLRTAQPPAPEPVVYLPQPGEVMFDDCALEWVMEDSEGRLHWGDSPSAVTHEFRHYRSRLADQHRRNDTGFTPEELQAMRLEENEARRNHE